MEDNRGYKDRSVRPAIYYSKTIRKSSNFSGLIGKIKRTEQGKYKFGTFVNPWISFYKIVDCCKDPHKCDCDEMNTSRWKSFQKILRKRSTLFLLARLTLNLATCPFYIIFLHDVTHCAVSRCAWRSYILLFLSVVFSLLVTFPNFPLTLPVPIIHLNMS